MFTTENSDNTPTMTENNPFSFRNGLDQVPSGLLRKVKEELMQALNIQTRAGFLTRVRGEVEPKVSEAKSIEAIFKQYGITKVWGDGHVNKSDHETTDSKI